MRLLVTRPKDEADETAARLTALGHAVTVQPLLTIVLASPPVGIAPPAAILFTSGNAVRAAAMWPEAAGWRALPVFAVGAATAERAAAAGFIDVRQGEADAAALAGTIAAALSPNDGLLLYPAAGDRTGGLEQRLAALGFRVTVVEAYRAQPASALSGDVRSALARLAIDGVLLYSRRTAETFLRLAAEAQLADVIRRPEYFVLSEEIAAPLSSAGLSVKVAERPDEASLLALIPPG